MLTIVGAAVAPKNSEHCKQTAAISTANKGRYRKAFSLAFQFESGTIVHKQIAVRLEILWQKSTDFNTIVQDIERGRNE